ncbi:MAG: DNA cytosine methyltransferase [Deltaproteobacteria bacterium]|jgi:DNA (cytosine-5)-methyltransferase 1|nr:DNA cytosine methyltransferase [Deltaproteobacteria bacterium]
MKTARRAAISLFSGAGGMDIGIRKAGFSVLAELEIDRFCCQTLRAAAQREGSGARVIEADIRTVDPKGLAETLGMPPRKLDLLFGGPPCQPFSLAGKRNGLCDDRGPLLFEIIRFAAHFKPKAILVEQVKGLLSAKGADGEKGGAFSAFLRGLESAGYTAGWEVCCAADYGIPQLRERLFVVATRRAGGFRFPERTHVPPGGGQAGVGLPGYVTVGEALAGLGRPSPKARGAEDRIRDGSHVDVTPSRDRERISHVPEGSCLAAQTHLGADIRGGLTAKDTTKYLRLSRKRPANTLRCGEIFFHPTEDRYLTPREYMRIHGYSDDYKLLGPVRSRSGSAKYLDQHRQVANSVPPPLAYLLGCAILKRLEKGNP